MFGSLRIGRPFGIDLSLHGTFWLLPAFVFLSAYMAGGLPAAVMNTGVVLAVFGCVALHELGHALAARLYGIRTQDITLYPIGGVARLERMPERPIQEIVVALAGPAVNVVIALGLLGVLAADGLTLGIWPSYQNPAHTFLARLMMANVGLMLFNLIPAFPMDGGRVLRAVVSWFTDRVTATRVAVAIGTVFAVLFGVYALMPPNPQPMLLILAVTVFLMGRQELEVVRREAEFRRRQRMWAGAYDIPTSRPDRPQDVWVYDARTGIWSPAPTRRNLFGWA
jgi:Zn-dependent protease